MENHHPILELEQIGKSYGTSRPTAVLEGADLRVEAGETLAIVGPSGCGKSTLLNLAGGLDRPTAGTVRFEGTDLASLDKSELARFRNESVGFVFQLHHLLPQCNVLENVLVPTLVRQGHDGAKDRAVLLLERVGLGHRIEHRPGQLSGGEQQRVAVVRALINKPRMLLADEPTGSLSEKGAMQLTQLLLELNSEENLTLMLVTHSMDVAKQTSRVLELSGGKLLPPEG